MLMDQQDQKVLQDHKVQLDQMEKLACKVLQELKVKQGTWVHPDHRVNLAQQDQWVSPEALDPRVRSVVPDNKALLVSAVPPVLPDQWVWRDSLDLPDQEGQRDQLVQQELKVQQVRTDSMDSKDSLVHLAWSVRRVQLVVLGTRVLWVSLDPKDLVDLKGLLVLQGISVQLEQLERMASADQTDLRAVWEVLER